MFTLKDDMDMLQEDIYSLTLKTQVNLYFYHNFLQEMGAGLNTMKSNLNGAQCEIEINLNLKIK